jgi:hypothetical protein
MDLIDASNAPEVPTVDPITGNPIVSNTAEDATMDNAMADQDVDMDTAESAGDIVDTTRTVYLFESMACDQKSGIIRNLSDIAHAWDIASPAAAFPYAYHPDPDTHNWGHALLTSLSRLAQMTQVTKSLQAQAIQHVVDHVQERNEGKSKTYSSPPSPSHTSTLPENYSLTST